MNSPFAFLIPPNPPLLTENGLQVQTISDKQLAYTFPASLIKSHIGIFLLPGQTLPAGSAAALYIQFPGQDYKFLGALGEGKASAIFRVAGLKGSQQDAGTEASAAPEVDMDADETQGADVGNVTIGVSLESAAEVKAQVDAQKVQPGTSNALVARKAAGVCQADASQPGVKELAQKIIKNAFNFLASFEEGNGKVPIKAFEDWWKRFERRLETDPSFLTKPQD